MFATILVPGDSESVEMAELLLINAISVNYYTYFSFLVISREIARALITFGISATEDLDMVAQIKSEVRKLTTKANICAQITVNDKADDKEYNLARMLYRPKPPEVKNKVVANNIFFRLSQRNKIQNLYEHLYIDGYSVQPHLKQ